MVGQPVRDVLDDEHAARRGHDRPRSESQQSEIAMDVDVTIPAREAEGIAEATVAAT